METNVVTTYFVLNELDKHLTSIVVSSEMAARTYAVARGLVLFRVINGSTRHRVEKWNPDRGEWASISSVVV